MRKAGEHDLSGAREDLLAVCRLGRLVTRIPTLTYGLTGVAIEGVAIAAACNLAHYGEISAKEAKSMRADLAAIPHPGEAAEITYFGERLVYLDSVLSIARDSPEFLLTVFELEQSPLAESLAASLVIDWDRPLRKGNQWFDRVAEIARITNPKERLAKSREYARSIAELGVRAKELTSLTRELAQQRPLEEIVNARVADGLVWYLMGTSGHLLLVYEREWQQHRMAMIALALAAYRADHRHYPERLDQLVPDYLEQVPQDVFAQEDSPIRYRRDGEAYVLWSVGRDGIDENARSYDDPPQGDDLVLRPEPAKKQDARAVE